MIFNLIEISLKGIDNFIEVGVIMMHQNAIGMIICQSYWVAIALY
jgi:hypothetical protein